MSLSNLRKNIDIIKDTYLLDENTDFLEEWRENRIAALKPFSENAANILSKRTSKEDLRDLFRTNLFMLLAAGCSRNDVMNAWVYERCFEIQKSPNGHLDLWARDHYKSTIITFAKSIQDILITHGRHAKGNECTIGIFSYTRSLAQGFLDQIKREFEENRILQYLFDDVLYANPQRDSARWSSQMGLIVKRETNPKEATVEAWGLVEGQPTSKHFSICVYDDIITHDTVKTMYLTQVANKSWENSLSLCSTGNGVRRYVGTRKNYADTYSLILEREAAIPRIYSPYHQDGKTPVLLTQERIDNLRKSQGEVTFMCEYMQTPLKDSALGFNLDNLMTHNVQSFANINLYCFCDPASSKKKTSDYTAFLVIGIDPNNNILVIDGIRDRLNPSERWQQLYKLHTAYPQIKKIFYEEVGMNNDLFYFKEKMNECGNFFDNKFINLKPLGTKQDRISRLEPIINDKKLFLPEKLPKISVNGNHYDLVKAIVIDELSKFPFPKHDDLLDCLGYTVEKLESSEISGTNQYDAATRIIEITEGKDNHGFKIGTANRYTR